jgi:hypothetical protein
MEARTIRADGMDWPLETYLDAYGFKRRDEFDPPPTIRHAAAVTLVREDLSLQLGQDAESVIWPGVIAFKLEGDFPGPCHWCGTSDDEDDMCADCTDGAEW